MLTDPERNALLDAIVTRGTYTAAIDHCGLSPLAVHRQRLTDNEFDCAIRVAEDYTMHRVADQMMQIVLDADALQRERVSIGKQLLRQRPPLAWADREDRTGQPARPIALPTSGEVVVPHPNRRRVFEAETTDVAETTHDQTSGPVSGTDPTDRPQPDGSPRQSSRRRKRRAERTARRRGG